MKSANSALVTVRLFKIRSLDFILSLNFIGDLNKVSSGSEYSWKDHSGGSTRNE